MFHSHFDPNKSFFISDIHANHKNIVSGVSSWEDGRGCRNFKTIHEMNDTIINSINNTVGENDYLFHLGDIIFGNREELYGFRKRINCKNLFHIFGNHDDKIRSMDLSKIFTWSGDYLEIFVNKQLICLFHYPISVWRECHKGSWCLCGHSHGQFEQSTVKSNNGKILDLGWENFQKPLSYQEINALMSKKNIIKHH